MSFLCQNVNSNQKARKNAPASVGGHCRAATMPARAAGTKEHDSFDALKIFCAAFARRYSSQGDELHLPAGRLASRRLARLVLLFFLAAPCWLHAQLPPQLPPGG